MLKGFVSPLLIVGVACAVLGVLLALQTHRLESCKADHAAFVAKVEAAGKEQERRAKETEAADRKRKEKADHENKTSRARIAALAGELRDARSRSRTVPTAPTGAASPENVTYDRAYLDAAISGFVEEVAKLIEAGDSAVADLNTARAWATQ